MMGTSLKLTLRVLVSGCSLMSTSAKPSRFPFLAIPGKTFNLISPDDRLEYTLQFLDDELITLVADETNRNAAEMLKFDLVCGANIFLTSSSCFLVQYDSKSAIKNRYFW